MGGGEYSTGEGARCPGLFVKDIVCGIPGRASLWSKNVVGPSGSTTRDRCVDTQQGGERCVASAGIGSRTGANLQRIVSSWDRSAAKYFVHLL